MEEKIKALEKVVKEIEPHLLALKDQICLIRDTYLELTTTPVTKEQPADWTCEGRVWEETPCHGCGRCNQKAVKIWQNKKRTMCKSCALELDKFNRKRSKMEKETQ